MSSNKAAAVEVPELEPLRFSRLKLMGKSAAHFAHGYGEETGALRKGTALHSYLIGATDSVVLYPGKVRNGKVWEAFKAENDGKTLLIASEFDTVRRMRDSLEAHPRAMELLGGGAGGVQEGVVQEERIDWTDSGRACRGTPDVVHLLPGGRKIGVELKTTVTSQPDRFRWQTRKFAYHAQCAWYKYGLERCLNYAPGPVVDFFVVAVESAAPYPVTVFRFDEESLLMGHKQCRLWLEQLLGCERAGHFPAYAESDVTLSVVDDEADGLDWSDE
jgi:hypothetical protein